MRKTLRSRLFRFVNQTCTWISIFTFIIFLVLSLLIKCRGFFMILFKQICGVFHINSFDLRKIYLDSIGKHIAKIKRHLKAIVLYAILNRYSKIIHQYINFLNLTYHIIVSCSPKKTKYRASYHNICSPILWNKSTGT